MHQLMIFFSVWRSYKAHQQTFDPIILSLMPKSIYKFFDQPELAVEAKMQNKKTNPKHKVNRRDICVNYLSLGVSQI